MENLKRVSKNYLDEPVGLSNKVPLWNCRKICSAERNVFSFEKFVLMFKVSLTMDSNIDKTKDY